ncbi:MAG: Na(+)/H(+) antiporter subunit B [Alkalispirochaeta sp.]
MSGEALFISAAVVSLLLIGMALGAIVVKSLVSAVVFMSSLSLLASVLFLFVAAPDVAITEAAIGSGLTTLVFVLALYRTRSAPAEDGSAPMNRADESSLHVRAAAAMGAVIGENDGDSQADTVTVADESRKEVSRA